MLFFYGHLIVLKECSDECCAIWRDCLTNPPILCTRMITDVDFQVKINNLNFNPKFWDPKFGLSKFREKNGKNPISFKTTGNVNKQYSA